ncbi:MAG: gamma-glutamylcyclotransferase family protein [Cyclobacteriaceae bacterium]
MPIFQIFVYGTLRRSGMYAHYLAASELLREDYLLKGYALYDYQQWYPYMIPQAGSTVVGDIYQVDEATLKELHELEGVDEHLYRFVYLEAHDCHTYLKYDDDVSDLKYIEGGDWLMYAQSLLK